MKYIKLHKVSIRWSVVALLLILLFTLTACSDRQDETPPTQSDPPVSTEQPTVKPPDEADSAEKEATLYIGTKADGFAEYPFSYEGDLTPEVLIAGIGELTGWDMTLAEAVTTGKGGMSVCFASGSALFAGSPEPQKDEFHMFSAEQLAETLLDSVKKTLQEGFTGELGDPDTLDIYYYMEGEQPLALPDIGKEWALDKPYEW